MRFRKKPVVIEAVRWDGNRVSETPAWLTDALENNTLFRLGAEIRVNTLEGVMMARAGDFIIRGVKGELYPCKPDIFEQTYEPAE